MSPVKPCPFDWKDDRNDKLKGGRLLGVTQHRFAYGYYDDGGFVRAIIAGKQHGEDMLSLLTEHSAELRELYMLVLRELGSAAHNPYGNVGEDSGETVFNHAHLHFVRRRAGQPASGMGLGLLVASHNALYERHMRCNST